MKWCRMRVENEGNFGTKSFCQSALLPSAQFSLSGRGYDRILEDSEMIQLHHVAEATNYRAFDRKLFGWDKGRAGDPITLGFRTEIGHSYLPMRAG